MAVKVNYYCNKNKKKQKKHISNLTGEDIEMFHEKEYEQKNKEKKNVCDTHIDGA